MSRGRERTKDGAPRGQLPKGAPTPTASFRRRAWLEFQRALDPLASPKPLKLGRR